MIYNTAIYLRVSKENLNNFENDSIKNQRALIYEYLKIKSDIKVFGEFIDNGYSGLNFERPAFKELMCKIYENKINCIIVKDLSRFSRNYIDVGKYISDIFPAMKVRFISIIDRYDSIINNFNDNLIMPFKSLINDYYCEDISKKTKSSLEIKRKKGEYVSAFAVYGYKKDENNKNKLIIDTVAANIVKKIFFYKLNGMSNKGISDKLNNLGIPSPLEYKNLLGIYISDNFKRNDISLWHEQTIINILKNPIYIGNLEQGKTTTINYKSKKSIKKDKKDWICKNNTHKAIISGYIFELVNKFMKYDTRVSPEHKFLYLFSGLIYCGICKKSMIRSRIIKNNKEYVYYICSSYKNKKNCVPHRVNESNLIKIIHCIILQYIKIFADMEDIHKNDISKIIKNNIEFEKNIISKLKYCKKAIEESYKNKIIDAKEYNKIKSIYSYKNELALKRLNYILKIKEKDEFELFKKYKNINKLTHLINVIFIDKILVYNKNRIELRLTYKIP